MAKKSGQWSGWGCDLSVYQSLLLISRNRVRVVKTYIFAIYTISREGQHQLTFSAFKVKWKWLEGKSTAEGVKILHNWNNLSSWVTLTLSVRSECHYCRSILVGHEDIVMDITLQNCSCDQKSLSGCISQRGEWDSKIILIVAKPFGIRSVER